MEYRAFVNGFAPEGFCHANKKKRSGFTLVELLVVIGIIALLISILLPALNRAKEEANLIECQSNLHAIGQMLSIYVADNTGYLPYGYAESQVDKYQWYWPDSLSLMTPGMKSQDGGYQAADFLKVFHDVDTPPVGYQPRACDYCANIRILPDCTAIDVLSGYNPTLGGASGIKARVYLPIRQLASISHPAEIMMVWCTAVDISDGSDITGLDNGNNDPISWQLDNSQINFGHGFSYPSPAANWFSGTEYYNPISLGNTGAASFGFTSGWSSASALPNHQTLMKALAAENLEQFNPQYNTSADMRFRHMNNTTANMLFVDMHVESRLLGSVVAKDICLNPKFPFASWPQ